MTFSTEDSRLRSPVQALSAHLGEILSPMSALRARIDKHEHEEKAQEECGTVSDVRASSQQPVGKVLGQQQGLVLRGALFKASMLGRDAAARGSSRRGKGTRDVGDCGVRDKDHSSQGGVGIRGVKGGAMSYYVRIKEWE